MHQQYARARVFRLSALSLALTLAACGGGGGGGASTPTPVAASRSVTGTAAKGIIKGGTVKVFAINADGTQGTSAVATGTTNDKGVFSVTIPADVLTFVVEVSGNASAKTADEATGLDLPIGDTFKLRNVVKLASAGETTYTGSVSPLTEMITKSAERAAGGLSAANIASAKTGFAAFFGFDPEKVTPINSNSAAAATASADEKLQSVMLAAISKMAKDGSQGCAGDSAAKLSCVVTAISALGTIGSGGLTVNDALTGAIDAAAAEVVVDKTINQTGTSAVAQLPKGTVPVVPPAATPILAATRLFDSLRTNITALSNGANNGALDIRADALRDDFDKATAPLDQDLEKWLQMSTRAIDFFNAYKAGGIAPSITWTNGDGSPLGGCAIYSDSTGAFDSPVASAPGNAVSVGCSGARKFVPESFLPDGTYKRVAIAFAIVPVAGSTSSYTYASQARIETWSGNSNRRNPSLDVPVGNYGGTANRARGSIEYVKTGATVNSIAFKGMMPARTDAYGGALTDHETWDVAASRSAEGGNVFKYTLAGSITSMKKDQAVGKLSIADGSFLRTSEKVEGNIVASGVKEFSLALAAEAGGSKVAGKLVMTEAMADKSGFDYQPTKIAFSGSLGTNNTEFFNGDLTFTQTGFNLYDASKPESASNYAKKSATLFGKVSIANRPALTLQLAATSLAKDKVSLTGQYNDGSNLVNLSVSDGTPAVTKISSVDGVSLTLTGAENVDVLKDGAKVAVLNTKTGKISFTDGSFFSLK